MFCKYCGKGNSTPSVLTVATSVPVDGFSPGSGATLGVVRGAASRFALSATGGGGAGATVLFGDLAFGAGAGLKAKRSEEHTSELQSRLHLVCRLLLEK